MFLNLWECVADVYFSPPPPAPVVVVGALRRRNKGCSTPCRSPGSLQTHSRRRWCHSPCHRAGHSRHTPPTHSSSRNTSRLLHRSRRWHSPAWCYTELGTHKRGRPEYSEHSSLQRKRDRVSEFLNIHHSEFFSYMYCIGCLFYNYVYFSPLCNIFFWYRPFNIKCI